MYIYGVNIKPRFLNRVFNNDRVAFFTEDAFEKEFNSTKINHETVSGTFISDLVIRKVIKEYQPYLKHAAIISKTINQRIRDDVEHISIRLSTSDKPFFDIDITIYKKVQNANCFVVSGEKWNMFRPDISKVSIIIKKEGDIYKPLTKEGSIKTSKQELMVLNALLSKYIPEEVRNKYKIIEKIENLAEDVIYSET